MLEFNLFVAGLFILSLLGIVIYDKLTIFRRLSWNRQKYQLYAIRDEFIERATTGDINPTSESFNIFYAFINTSIVAVEQLSFHELVRQALRGYREVRPEVEASFRQISREIPDLLVQSVRILMDMILFRSRPYRVVVYFSTQDGIRFLSCLQRLKQFLLRHLFFTDSIFIKIRTLIQEPRELVPVYNWANRRRGPYPLAG